jgi:hypothetical protein
VQLYDLKVCVWGATSAHRTIQPVYFHEIINSERYVRLSPFFCQLTHEKLYRHFMQDNATAHIVNNSVVTLDEVFSE